MWKKINFSLTKLPELDCFPGIIVGTSGWNSVDNASWIGHLSGSTVVRTKGPFSGQSIISNVSLEPTALIKRN